MFAPLLVALPPSPLDLILNDPKLDGALVAATVTDLDGKVLYERNAGMRVVPASNQKLLSNAFALHALGPSFRPQTKIWKLVTKTVVDSPGDPLLSHRILMEARQRLRLNRYLPVHVREAYAPGVPASWEVDDLPNKYAAPITAFTVDRGSFELWNVNGKPTFRPDPYGTKVERAPGVLGNPPQISYDPFTRRVRIVGALPIVPEARLDTLALPKPDEAAARLLGFNMVPTTEVPNREPDLVILGSPTSEMIKACLPPSDNNVAEHLFLLGAKAQGALAADPYATARERMTNFLTATVGARKEDFRVYDGSGMSRHNLVTARGIAQLLTWQNRQPTAGVWRAALARPGVGTLGSRMQGLSFEGKTGSLDMVVALSGYVKVADGSERIVSVIFNHFTGSATDARNIADSFVKGVAAG
ncbi:MAG: D-alanyl-D-alanine carboxypeptidase/D-alanyl-D-alanine-endopeptidase [Fimbriimonas sp.]